MDPQLLDQLRQTVQVASRTGRDVFGKGTYGTAVKRAARIIGHNEMARDVNGREVVSAIQVIVNTTLNLTDQIWLPGEDPLTDEGHVPIAVGERVGEVGAVDHVKVWLRGFIR